MPHSRRGLRLKNLLDQMLIQHFGSKPVAPVYPDPKVGVEQVSHDVNAENLLVITFFVIVPSKVHI